MSGIPDGVQTVTGEGVDLRAAVANAAEQLGVPAGQVGHKLDMSWFRSPTGAAVARSTVRVVAWAKAEGEVEAPREERPARPPREERAPREDRPPREERAERPPREDRPPREERAERAPRIPMPEGAETEASRIAKQWFEMVTQGLGLEASVSATGTEDRVRVRVKADAAGRLIGRRGTTLAAIRHLLALALREHGEFIIDVDVDDERGDRPPRDEDAPRRDDRRSDDRGPRRDDRGPRRDDRGPRRDDGPARTDDRGPRRDDRGPRRDDRRDDRGPRRDDRRDDRAPERRSAFSEEKLQELGRRAAEKAVSSGKPITIKLELNSYDRRIVHLEVGEIDGVESQSVVIDGIKYIQVVPAGRG